MIPVSKARLHGLGAALAAMTVAASPVPTDHAQSPFARINAAAKADPIVIHRLRGNVSMLEGSGGNITAFATPAGFFLVDTGIAVSQRKILGALAKLDRGRIRLAVDTHWHWDHADGNGWVRAAGASIIADAKAYERLTQTIRVVEWENTFRPKPVAELPDIVISDTTTLHVAGERILIRPYQPGHTDGDVSVYFENADILSVGDTFWNGQYPFIDYVTGGSIDGAIAAANANIAMAGDKTIIVPGHGPVGDRASQIAFRDMLVAIRGRVAVLKAKGMTVEQVQAERPTADYDAKWGRSIIGGSLFTALVYRGV